jgi:hypothetical protein
MNLHTALLATMALVVPAATAAADARLAEAARTGDSEAVAGLLRHGADVSAPGPDGTTATRRLAAPFAASLLILLILLAPARAHHAFDTEFDAKRRVTLRGVVTKVEWVNPHAWIHVEVAGPDGDVETWAVQAAGPEALTGRGWRSDSLLPGTEVVIDAFQARNGTRVANGRDITLPDGRQLCADIPCRCCHH